MEAAIKIALLAALAILTLGVIPDRRRGAVIPLGQAWWRLLSFISSRRKVGR
jgi:hypothetical protein